jgi:hypothetical protein
MSDELTPEEKAALASLPRERMPAGLEERVVEGMRKRGFLARPRRTIELSNARVAGLVAASVALMIGAYSIGLYRGDTGEALRAVQPQEMDDRGRASQAPAESPPPASEAPEPPESKESRQEEPRALAEEATQAQPKVERADRADALMPTQEAPEAARTGVPAPASGLKMSAKRTTALDAGPEAGALSKRPLTFMLNGSPVIVEAPDSVRVVEDEQGRTLLIYTSDGVIRIRLADER